VETALFRVAQEAMTNARKHAQTTRLHLTLTQCTAAVRLEVRDEGRGFAQGTAAPAGPGERVGMAGMQERIRLLNGSFRVTSTLGKGTSVAVEVPL
jgi:signal transduction histidine kinase